jgi:hypothetical protein
VRAAGFEVLRAVIVSCGIREEHSSTLKMKAGHSSETLVNVYQTERRHISEETHHHGG